MEVNLKKQNEINHFICGHAVAVTVMAMHFFSKHIASNTTEK